MIKKTQPLVHNKKNNNAGINPMNNEDLGELDLPALEKLAASLERLTGKIHVKISQKKIQYEREITLKKEFRNKRNAIESLIAALHDNYNYETTLDSIAQSYKIDRDQLDQAFIMEIKINDHWARQARRAAAIRLAQAGMTNGEIADRLKVHRNTVSADIRRSINKTWNKPTWRGETKTNRPPPPTPT